MNGLPVREHLGRRVHDVAPWIPEPLLAVLRGVLEGESAIGLEITIDDPRFGAEARHFVASFLPLRGPGGARHRRRLHGERRDAAEAERGRAGAASRQGRGRRSARPTRPIT